MLCLHEYLQYFSWVTIIFFHHVMKNKKNKKIQPNPIPPHGVRLWEVFKPSLVRVGGEPILPCFLEFYQVVAR